MALSQNDVDKIVEGIRADIHPEGNCVVFDKETIAGIKAIASLFNTGKKMAKTTFIGAILLGIVITFCVGAWHQLKGLLGG